MPWVGHRFLVFASVSVEASACHLSRQVLQPRLCAAFPSHPNPVYYARMFSSSLYVVNSYEDWRSRWGRLFGSPDIAFSSLAEDVLAYLDRLGIRTVILESEYLDEDYAAAYSQFYSCFFRPPPKTCSRHLFFTADFKEPDDVRHPEISRSFCGFVTIWPTSPPVIGRSALPFPDGVDVKIAAPYYVHVSGCELTLENSAMFASKDHGVAVCASISTWLATGLMHRSFDLRSCSSTEITILATGEDPKWGRPLPQTRGLDPEQIIRALTYLDYSPHVYYSSDDNFDWPGYLYGYISSGIPVLVVCDVTAPSGGTYRHIVVGVGLRAKPREELDRQGSIGTSFTKTLDSVVIHDDRWGIYGSLTPKPGQRTSATLTYNSGVKMTTDITGLIVPLPKGIVLVSEYAYRLGVTTLRAFMKKQNPQEDYNGPFRTFLKPSVDLKRESWGWPEDLQRVAARLRRIPMPRWVWVTESYPKETVALTAADQPLARAFFDPTALRFDKERLLLMGHVGGTVIAPPASQPGVWAAQEDQPAPQNA